MATRISIPAGATMKYRKNGRTLYGVKSPVIVWRTTPPPKGTIVYVVAWANGQQNLLASKIETQP